VSRAVIVIGGGVVGCAAAHELARRGAAVTVLERGEIGAGCSRGNCGYISPSHVDPLCVPGAVLKALLAAFHGSSALTIAPRADRTLARWLHRFRGHCTPERALIGARARDALLKSSVSLYDTLLADAPVDPEHERAGLLLVYRTEAEFQAHAPTAARLGAEYGVVTEAVPPERLSTFEPALVDGLGGGWWYPGDAHARPDRVVAILRQRAEEAGVRFLGGREVSDLAPAEGPGGPVRVTARPTGTPGEPETFSGEAAVIATGALAPALATRLGVDLGIVPGKGYSITFPASEGMPRRPLVLEEHHVAVTPFADTFRVGSTMEFTGYDDAIRPDRIALLRRAAAEHLRHPIEVPALEEWCGWRPMSADDVPSIGPLPGAPGIHVAAGNGMVGLSTAPATGRLLAELVLDEPPHIDPAPYAPGRFGRG